MGYNTGLRTALDTYTYWSTPKSQYVTLLVLTQGVDVGFGVNVGSSDAVAAMFPPIDEYFPPGSLLRPQEFDAVRIKNHVAGSAAQYSLATRLSDDLPEGVPLGASFAPNYQTVNADGTVGALFTGGVQLNEYIFPATHPLFDPQGNALSWIRPDNTPSGQIVSERSALGPPDTLLIRSILNPADGIPHGQVTVQIMAGSLLSNVQSRLLLDEAGNSAYGQTANNLSDLASKDSAKTNLDFGYGASLTNAADQAIAASTFTVCTLPTKEFDSSTGSALTATANRITFPTGGVYIITGSIRYAVPATVFTEQVNLRFNGTLFYQDEESPSSTATAKAASMAIVKRVVAADFVELVAFAGAAATVHVARLTAAKIG